MLKLNGPPVRSSFCSADRPQCAMAALRYRDRRWPLQSWFGERMVVEVTDSKNPDQAAHVMSLGAWDRFLRDVHQWRPRSDGLFHLGWLRFTADEVQAFIAGVDAGEFYRSLIATT